MKVLIKRTKFSEFEIMSFEKFKSIIKPNTFYFQLVSGELNSYYVHINSLKNKYQLKKIRAYSLEHAKLLFPKKHVTAVSIRT